MLVYEFPLPFGNKQRILEHSEALRSRKLHRLASKNRILLRLSSCIPSFPKFTWFKIISALNVIYSFGIFVTLMFVKNGRIHMKLGAVVTVSITGLVGLMNTSYNFALYFYSDQINWTMGQVKQLAYNHAGKYITELLTILNRIIRYPGRSNHLL